MGDPWTPLPGVATIPKWPLSHCVWYANVIRKEEVVRGDKNPGTSTLDEHYANEGSAGYLLYKYNSKELQRKDSIILSVALQTLIVSRYPTFFYVLPSLLVGLTHTIDML